MVSGKHGKGSRKRFAKTFPMAACMTPLDAEGRPCRNSIFYLMFIWRTGIIKVIPLCGIGFMDVPQRDEERDTYEV